MYQLMLPKSQSSRSFSFKAREAHLNILAWQNDISINKVADLVDSCTGKARAKRTKQPSYLSSAERSTTSSRNTSMETRKPPSTTAVRKPGRRDAVRRAEQDRRETVANAVALTIEDVQPKTHHGGSKPLIIPFQQSDGVQLIRSSVPMAMATAGAYAFHGREQDFLCVGAQFEDDRLEDSEWVFV